MCMYLNVWTERSEGGWRQWEGNVGGSEWRRVDAVGEGWLIAVGKWRGRCRDIVGRELIKGGVCRRWTLMERLLSEKMCEVEVSVWRRLKARRTVRWRGRAWGYRQGRTEGRWWWGVSGCGVRVVARSTERPRVRAVWCRAGG